VKTIQLNKDYLAYIDDEDYDKVKNFDWKVRSYTKNGKTYLYAYRNLENDPHCKEKTALLHHFICGRPPAGQTLFFKDGNGLNCQKDNICFVSFGKKTYRFRNSNTSPESYRGVRKYYISRIKYENKLITLGYFNNERDAAIAYNMKAIELFGENATLNDID
jgi:hypothetical protein